MAVATNPRRDYLGAAPRLLSRGRRRRKLDIRATCRLSCLSYRPTGVQQTATHRPTGFRLATGYNSILRTLGLQVFGSCIIMQRPSSRRSNASRWTAPLVSPSAHISRIEPYDGSQHTMVQQFAQKLDVTQQILFRWSLDEHCSQNRKGGYCVLGNLVASGEALTSRFRC